MQQMCQALQFRQPPASHHSYSVRFRPVSWLPFNGEVAHAVRTVLSRTPGSVVLDVAGVSAIDAAGIGELVRAYNIATASNVALRIVNANSRVREMLERVGLFGRLNAVSVTTRRGCPASDR